MPETINWSVVFDVKLGPTVTASGVSSVAAYDKVRVVLDAVANPVDVDIQPSAGASDVSVLVVTADRYGTDVSYSADAGATTFDLDGPLALIGAGAVSLLAAPPRSLQFVNSGAAPVEVQILVGRTA